MFLKVTNDFGGLRFQALEGIFQYFLSIHLKGFKMDI